MKAMKDVLHCLHVESEKRVRLPNRTGIHGVDQATMWRE